MCVNEEDIRFLGGASYAFKDGDEVLLVPSIAGGRIELTSQAEHPHRNKTGDDGGE